MQDFIYMKETQALMQIVLLGFILSVPVCYFVESLKSTGIRDGRFYLLSSALISLIFAVLFSLCFAKMNLYEVIWLSIMLWMASQGFYEHLKTSDGWMGKYFISLAKMIDEEKAGDDGKEEEEDVMIFPVNYVGISTAFSAFHPAVDFGFSNSRGGKNQDIIAPCDMTVVSVGESGSIGKYIRAHAECGGEKYTFRFIHLSEISVRKGDSIGKGEKIGKMGNTGSECNGHHLHFDIWKGHTKDLSSDADRYEKSVNPLKLCHLGKNQTAGEETDRRYEIKRV